MLKVRSIFLNFLFLTLKIHFIVLKSHFLFSIIQFLSTKINFLNDIYLVYFDFDCIKNRALYIII